MSTLDGCIVLNDSRTRSMGELLGELQSARRKQGGMPNAPMWTNYKRSRLLYSRVASGRRYGSTRRRRRRRHRGSTPRMSASSRGDAPSWRRHEARSPAEVQRTGPQPQVTHPDPDVLSQAVQRALQESLRADVDSRRRRIRSSDPDQHPSEAQDASDMYDEVEEDVRAPEKKDGRPGKKRKADKQPLPTRD